jgi:hypothetical protein
MLNKILQGIAVGAVVLLLIPTLSISAEQKVMVATNASGRVMLQSTNGTRRSVVSTQVLHSGDSLTTAENSLATVQLADVGKVKLGPTTTATTYSRSGELDVHIAQGSACVQSEQPAVAIYAGGVSLSAASPSTIFDLEQNTGDTKVAVYQGSVTATTPGATPKQLPAGTAAAAAPGGTVHPISLASINVDFASLDCPAPAVAEAALAIAPASQTAAASSSSGSAGGIIAVILGLGAIAAAAHGGGGGSHSGPAPVFPTPAPTGTIFPKPSPTLTGFPTGTPPPTGIPSPTPIPSATPTGFPTGTPPPTGIPSPTPIPSATPTGFPTGTPPPTGVPSATPIPTTPVSTPTPFPTATLASASHLTVNPGSVSLGPIGGAQTVMVSDAVGNIRVATSSPGVSVSPSSASGPHAAFTISARAPGQSQLTFIDDAGRTVTVRVVVAARR